MNAVAKVVLDSSTVSIDQHTELSDCRCARDISFCWQADELKKLMENEDIKNKTKAVAQAAALTALRKKLKEAEQAKPPKVKKDLVEQVKTLLRTHDH